MTEDSAARRADEVMPEVLDAAATALGGGPVQMVNLLRYRTRAEYGPDSGNPPSSGRAAYFERYLPAFNAVAAGPLRDRAARV